MRRRSNHHLNPPAAALPVLASIVAILASPAAIAQTVFLEGGRVIPVVGPPLNKANVLIKNGKIAEIGPDVEAPFDARVYDVSGKTLFPGMIDVHTNGGGVDRANETPRKSDTTENRHRERDTPRPKQLGARVLHRCAFGFESRACDENAVTE